MSLDIWTNEDIQATVLSVALATVATTAAHETPNAQFCAGALWALRSMALAYRLNWAEIEATAELGAHVAGLLDQAATLTIVGGQH